MFNRLKSYIIQNRNRLGYHTSLVPDPSFVDLDDIHVQGVSFKGTEDDSILFRASIQADVVIKGRSRRDYEEDMVNPWFSITFTAILRGGLNMVTITSIEEYTRDNFNKENALSRYLVSYISSKDLDLYAEKLLKKYCPKALETPMSLPLDEILEAMCLTMHFAPLKDGIFGRTYFKEADVDIYDDEQHNVVSTRIEEGTILVNPDAFFMRNIGSVRNTIIHECVHWDMHYKFFELQKLLNPEISSIACAVVEKYDKPKDALSEEYSWMEWQANALAPKILIPARTGRAKFIEIYTTLSPTPRSNAPHSMSKCTPRSKVGCIGIQISVICHVAAYVASFAAVFYLYRTKPPLARSVAAPLRKRSRLLRLLGCKRPRNASAALSIACGAPAAQCGI